MRLRRIQSADTHEVQAEGPLGWVSLGRIPDLAAIGGEGGDLAHDMLAVLALGTDGWSRLSRAIEGLEPNTASAHAETLPFAPASFRDFMLFEEHVVAASRGYAKRFLPKLYPLTQLTEKLTGKPFPKFRPHPLWYQQPIYYLSNHLNIRSSGSEIRWPDYTDALDYELELGAVLAHPLENASPEDAQAAIGGFVVLNDFSARDVQKDEMDSGFGPQKAKHFASSISEVVVTSDEILPYINELDARVDINGEVVARCSSRGMHHSMAEAIAFASKSEPLFPGELFGSGTLPGGAGIENNAWLAPGDRLRLTIDRVGSVENTISRETKP
ncbi:MAG: fumarylacetoacetate hydrolase family protein [Pseudomonadota bacterium]